MVLHKVYNLGELNISEFSTSRLSITNKKSKKVLDEEIYSLGVLISIITKSVYNFTSIYCERFAKKKRRSQLTPKTLTTFSFKRESRTQPAAARAHERIEGVEQVEVRR